MLSFLWGRAGSGKTTYIADRICQRAASGDSGLIWLVPEPFSHECERLLAKTGGPPVCLSAEVITFGRLADRVLSPYGASRGVLDEGGRLLTMRLAVDSVRESLELLAKNAHKPVFLKALIGTLDDCKCYGISPETLLLASENAAGSAALKLRELSMIFSAYDAVIARGRLDPRDRMTLLAETLTKGEYARDKTLYIDSFVTFTPQERDVVRAFIGRGAEVTVSLTGEPDSPDFAVTRRCAAALSKGVRISGQTVLEGSRRYKSPALESLERGFFDDPPEQPYSSGDIRAVCACSPGGECDFIAGEIRRLAAHGVRYRDIVVAVHDLPKYGPRLEQSFERAGIPVFMDDMDEVADKPLCRFLKLSGDIVAKGFRSEDVAALLDTGLFRLRRSMLYRFEGYLRRWKPEGKRWASDFTMHPRGYTGEWTDEDVRLLGSFNRIRALIYAPLSLLKNGKNAGGWTRALLLYVKKCRLQAALSRRMKALRAGGELKAADECAQLWEILLAAVAQCAGILDETPMGLDTYMELLLLSLSGVKVGSIPVSLDRVSVGAMGRLRRFSAKIVFAPGCGADSMPRADMPPGLLSTEERAALEALDAELPPDSEKRLERENHNIYTAFTLPSEKLYLSFSREPTGEELPADALLRACKLSGAEIESLAPPEREWSPPEDMRAPLGREAVEGLYGKNIRLSATRLETLFDCKFAFFCRYGLRALPDAEAGYSPLDTGLFIHEILEKTGRRVVEEGGARLVEPEKVREWASEYAGDYARRVLRGFGDYGMRFRRRFDELARSGALIAENVNAELAAGEFSPAAFELKFGGADGQLPPIWLPEGPDGFSFRLEGKVDRVDCWRAPEGRIYVRVVDYKTGAREFSLRDLYYGKGIQLPLYLFALARTGGPLLGADSVAPAGMLYLPARRPLISAKTRMSREMEAAEMEDKLRRDGLLLADEGVLKAMGASGDKPSPFLPVKWKNSVLQPDSLASKTQMELLSGHVDRLLDGAVKALAEGDVSADPLAEDSRNSACTWCEFSRCCYLGEDDRGRRVEKDLKFWETLDKNGNGEAEK